MSSYFLPLGLLLAFLAAWLAPETGSALQRLGLVPWMVVVIFLINGYQAELAQLPRGPRILVVSLVAIPISLLISPFVGVTVAAFIHLPAGAAMGLILMACVPPTLSSGIVLTGVAGGNVMKALYLTMLLNLVGIFTIPFMLQLTLDSLGLVSISPWPLLRQLVLIVLVPFLVGMGLRRIGRSPWRHGSLKYIPSVCVILTVWMSVSVSMDRLQMIDLGLLLRIAVAALAVHLVLLCLCWLVRFAYRPDWVDWLALLFTVSQKTLPVALGVLAAVGQHLGLAMIVCILFHFLQLFVDSVLASRLARLQPTG